VAGYCGRVGPLRNERRDVKSKPLEKKEWRYAGRLIGTNILKEGTMWLVTPLLGKYREISIYTRAVARVWLCKQHTVLDIESVAITWSPEDTKARNE
jgi:hypothetical protein